MFSLSWKHPRQHSPKHNINLQERKCNPRMPGTRIVPREFLGRKRKMTLLVGRFLVWMVHWNRNCRFVRRVRYCPHRKLRSSRMNTPLGCVGNLTRCRFLRVFFPRRLLGLRRIRLFMARFVFMVSRLLSPVNLRLVALRVAFVIAILLLLPSFVIGRRVVLVSLLVMFTVRRRSSTPRNRKNRNK